MSETDLFTLIDRVEQATAADQRDLLEKVCNYLLPNPPAEFARQFRRLLDAEGYETAALALVERLLPLPYGTLNFGLYDGVAQILVDTDDHQTIGGAVVQTTASSTGQARTLPLAIIAALLRALAQQKQGEQK